MSDPRPDWLRHAIYAPGGTIGPAEMLEAILARMIEPRDDLSFEPGDKKIIPASGYESRMDYAREAFLMENGVERGKGQTPIGPTSKVWLRHGRRAMRTIAPWQVRKGIVEGAGQDILDLVMIPLDLRASGQAEPAGRSAEIISRLPGPDWKAGVPAAYGRARRETTALIVERLRWHLDNG